MLRAKNILVGGTSQNTLVWDWGGVLRQRVVNEFRLLEEEQDGWLMFL